MPVVINSNSSAFQVQRILERNTAEAQASVNRLSSGLRINAAGDDAAGLAVASALQTDTRIYTQAIRNVNDGASALAIAEEALHVLSNITTRQRELATQSANGILSLAQRRAIDAEASALTNEYNRIVKTVKFNGRELLNAEESLNIHAGASARDSVSFSIGSELSNAAAALLSSEQSSASISGATQEITTFDFYDLQTSERFKVAFRDATSDGDRETSIVNFWSDGNGIKNATGVQYIDFQTSQGNFSVSFIVDDLGWSGPTGDGHDIRVHIYSGDDAETIGQKVATAINEESCGASAVGGSQLYIYDTALGARTDIGRGSSSSAFGFGVDHQGIDATRNNYEDYTLQFHSNTTQYSISFDAGLGSTVINGNSAVVGIGYGASAYEVASKVHSLLETWNAGFTLSVIDHTSHDGTYILTIDSPPEWGNVQDGTQQYNDPLLPFESLEDAQGGSMTLGDSAADGLALFTPDGNGYGLFFDGPSDDFGNVPFPGVSDWYAVSWNAGWSVPELVDETINIINLNLSSYFTATRSGSALTITNKQAGAAQNAYIADFPGPEPTRTAVQDGSDGTAINTATDTLAITSHGLTTGTRVRLTSSGTLPTGLSSNTDYYVIKVNNDSIKLAASAANAASNTAINLTSAGTGTHILTAYSDTQGVVLSALVDRIDLSSQAGAKRAMADLDQRLSAIGRELGAVGSGQSRLSTMRGVLDATRENYSASSSRIMDVDFAGETAIYSKQMILQQSGAAILAQANMLPSLALKLLNFG